MKIWTLLTDSDEGTFSQVFTTEADRDTRCFDLCKDKWDNDEDGDMPQDWRAAYAVMQGRSCEWWFHLAEHDIPLPAPAFNCLPAGETLEDLCRRDHICGFDLRFTKSMLDFRNYDQFGSDMQECNPSEATHATIYAMNDLGEAIAIHDAELTEAGADEVAATCRALFSAIVLAHRPQPDAAQIHQAEQDRISEDANDRNLLAMAMEADAGHPAITSDELLSQIITAGALQEDDGEPD